MVHLANEILYMVFVLVFKNKEDVIHGDCVSVCMGVPM